MNKTRFNRHTSMSTETTTEILHVCSEVCLMDDPNMELENMLYGLLDGCLYEDVPVHSLKLPAELGSRVMNVYNECSQYPRIN